MEPDEKLCLTRRQRADTVRLPNLIVKGLSRHEKTLLRRIISAAMFDFKRPLIALSLSLLSTINPFARITRVFIVGPGAGNSRHVWNPILTQKIVGVTVLLGQLPDLMLSSSCESAITNDPVLPSGLGGDREGRKKQMNVQVAIEKPV